MKKIINFNKQESLIAAALKNKEILFEEFSTSINGYNDDETIQNKRKDFGSNKISKTKHNSSILKFIKAFINPFTFVLLFLAAISSFTDIFMAAPSDKSYSGVVIIISMVLISATLSFAQEEKSSRAAEKLAQMIKTTTLVLRFGKQEEIPITELVAGDIICLAAGDMIPADCRILEAKDLFVRQSSLTGESEPVEKLTTSPELNSKNPIDYKNLAFMGTNIISGTAKALVVAVGDKTLFGQIAQKLASKKEPTSFEKGLDSISWIFIRFTFVMVPIVFFINGFTKGDWMQAFLFALSVAVGLTPEMLPMIVSTNLAKGAILMSKKKVIVKNLNAIQNFGAMDVLCTDKTGTITQDKIILEYHLDINGKEDEKVLHYAFLNSHFQTGLKNLMDVSIIEHLSVEDREQMQESYTKIDEIPFDFNRRRMSVVVRDKNNEEQIVTKGAIEEMLSICSYVEYENKTEKLSPKLKEEIIKRALKYNSDGMRVLAVAHKVHNLPLGAFSVNDESNMGLVGFLTFLDPPKDGAKTALKALRDNGIIVKVLTGDNDVVTKSICHQVGIDVDKVVLGSEIADLDDIELEKVVEEYNVFAKLSPEEKARIVICLRKNQHVVGFMGDGINDTQAMKAADVGISVDTAVDIAKETANIILLEKNLMVLGEGAIEGRRVYANIIKYIKITASSNFGNMFSVLLASCFLPFLPMLPIQILLLNLIYDFSCVAMPWDNVDNDYIKVPHKWDANAVSKFMIWIGPTSSVFDVITYILMFFIIGPLIFGASYHELSPNNRAEFAALFQTGWFIESLWTQTFVIHMLRTDKLPFIQSRASLPVFAMTTLGIIVGTSLGHSGLGSKLGMHSIPWQFYPALLVIIFLYMILVTILKKAFIKIYRELL